MKNPKSKIQNPKSKIQNPKWVVRGRAWKFGDKVNTDLIYPGKFLPLREPSEMARHAMAGLDPSFAAKAGSGDIVVAGRHFGCGSSREQAAASLSHLGIGAVVAVSFARIFFRNAINIGLPVVACPGVAAAVREGEVVTVELESGMLSTAGGRTLRFAPLPPFLLEILRDGGLIPHLRKSRKES